MKAKSTKRALLSSLLALVLCFSMLLGTTFAWFTDSVTSANNIIQAGNLDVELYYQAEGETTWTKVTETTNVFKDGVLWEPGHTEVVKLKVVNEGSLALKYQLGVNVASETGSVNMAGEAFKLSDYIKFGIIDGAQTYTREEAIAEAEKNATALATAYKSGNTALAAKNDNADTDEKVVTMVVYMPTSVGNEANAKTGEAVPTINLGINLLATQVEAEGDSFDTDYDKDAGYDYGKTNVGPYKLNVLADANAAYDSETKTYTIPVQTIAQGGYNASQGNKYYAGYTVNVAGYGENATVSFDKDTGEVVWKLADEEKGGFIVNGVHQQWTSAGTVRAYRYDIDGDGVTDFTVVNDASAAKVQVADAEQLKKVMESGASAVLNADIVLTEALTVPAGATATLDLNGKTVTAPSDALWAIQNNGTLTVTGNGTMEGSYTALYSNGNLTIENGTFTATNGFGVLIDNIYGTEASVAVINGGTFTGLGIYNPTDVTINGGTFNVGRDPDGATDQLSDEMTLFISPTFVGAPNTANVVLNGGTFNGDVYVYDDGITETVFVNNGATINGDVLDNG